MPCENGGEKKNRIKKIKRCFLLFFFFYVGPDCRDQRDGQKPAQPGDTPNLWRGWERPREPQQGDSPSPWGAAAAGEDSGSPKRAGTPQHHAELQAPHFFYSTSPPIYSLI